jgi:predicted membrane protein
MNIRILIGLIIIFLGLSILFNFDFPIFKILLALLFIFIGWKVVTNKTADMPMVGQSSTAREDLLKRVMIFSGINTKIQSDNFSGGEVVAIFGGGDIDLSEVKVKGDSLELNLVAIFGGLKITVPDDWNVKTEGVGVLGGFENKADTKKSSVTAVIKGVAIFGGVEIVS